MVCLVEIIFKEGNDMQVVALGIPLLFLKHGFCNPCPKVWDYFKLMWMLENCLIMPDMMVTGR